MVCWYMRYKRPWAYYIDCILWSNVYVLGGFGSNGFMTKVQSFPMSGYYRTDIISSVGHPKLDSVVPLVLCMVACNGWSTDIILQVPRGSTNLAKKE